MSRLSPRLAAAAVSALLVTVFPNPGGTPIQARATLQLVASGLYNPRGLNFGPEGALYVAEAGSGGAGPCIVTSGSEFVCYGPTGAITRIVLGGALSQTRVVTGLPSLATQAGQAAGGPVDVDFQGRGNGYVTIAAGFDPARRLNDPGNPDFASVGLKFGRLVRFKPNGKWTYEEDLSGFEALANPDGGLYDSNPYGILAGPGRVIFTDAGGNSVNAVAANGAISNLAVLPSRLVQNPFAPPGVMIPMQGVPTTVTPGPDGALYVGQLTGFPFPAGGANVYRVPANGGAPTVAAGGFTKIIDLAFAADGSMYVLEITAAGGPPPGLGPGALIRISPDGLTRTTVVAPGEGLVSPGGIAIAADGSIYVTNFTVQGGGAGQVVRVVP